MRYRGLDAVPASSKKMVQAVPDTIMYTRGILQVRDTVVTNIKHACATHSVLQDPAMCALLCAGVAIDGRRRRRRTIANERKVGDFVVLA